MLRSLPLLSSQMVELLLQTPNFPAQGFVVPQQSLHIAGDTFSLVLPNAIVTGRR